VFSLGRGKRNDRTSSYNRQGAGRARQPGSRRRRGQGHRSNRGALCARRARFQTQNVAGASAGAIVAALHSAGYTSAELQEIIGELDYDRFKDRAWEDQIPFAGSYLSILKDRGIYEGNEFLEFISGLLEYKGVRTFADLIRDADEDQVRYRYKVQVIVSDITDR
jgi:NTE family protein